MKVRAIALAIGITCITTTFLTGQEDLLSQYYGEGVHFFFRGQPDCARSYFDQAIANGSRDPRVYYFRGLTHACGMLTPEAEEDFRMAATLEVEGTGTYDIGRALERIQGPQRMQLERIRRDTLVTLSRRRPALPLQQQFQGVPMQPTIPDFGRDLKRGPDPFADEEPEIKVLPKEEPEVEKEDLPAGPARVDEPEEDDVFGTGTPSDDMGTEPPSDTQPDEEPATPAESDSNDIFGEDAGDDPFAP